MLKNLFAVLMSMSLLLRLEDGSDLATCNPHRFVRQFRLDQGAVPTRKVCAGLQDAENQYTRAGRDHQFENFASIYWPSLAW